MVDDLSEFKFVALDTAIRHVLAVRGIDLVRTEWLKALGQGLHEFRVRHEADEIARMFGGEPSGVAAPREKVLLRVFVHFHGDEVALLLGGYDKGKNPKEKRQQREATRARKLLAQFEERLSDGADAHGEVFAQAYEIALQVVALREQHGLTQAELAQRCGMDQGDISCIERGSTSPTTRTLQRIAEVLDADVRLVARAS